MCLYQGPARRALSSVAPGPWDAYRSGAETRLDSRTWWAACRALLSVVALTGALIVIYGPGALGYDGAYALLWGNDIAHGAVPQFQAPTAPTPHPLANAVGAALSLLGGAAPSAFVVLTMASFAVLGYAAFILGSRVFSRPVGALFALILLTRATLVHEAAVGLVDIPFLALVLSAAVLEFRDRRRPGMVIGLLVAAGLLRPEAWLLSLAYVVYRWPRASARGRVCLALGACAAPVIWAFSDLLATGDPLFSFHGTRALAERLDRPRAFSTALDTAPDYLAFLMGQRVMWLGLVGCLAGLAFLYERSLLPAAVAGLGLLAFLSLGLADLPLLTRYLLLPAVMLTLFAAVAVLGWLSLARPDPVRRWWAVAGGLLGVVLVAGALDDGRALKRSLAILGPRGSGQARLEQLGATTSARAAARRCPRVYSPSSRSVPLLAYSMGLRSGAVTVGLPSANQRAALLRANLSALAVLFSIDRAEATMALRVAPPRFHAIANNVDWTLYASC
jgi:hypothetical protein